MLIITSAKILIAISLLAGCSNEGMMLCPRDLQPVSSAPPIVNNHTASPVVGYVKVKVKIKTSGEVEATRVISSELKPIGRGRVNLTSYESATLKAVSDWRFPSRDSNCEKEIVVEFRTDP